MNVATHIDLTRFVLEAVGWPGDTKLAARSAAYPDEVRALEVEGLGAHVVGRNLASLTHFVVPCGEGKFSGYCWKRDRSVPHLDLTSREVVPKPEAWGFPAGEPFVSREPLYELVRDLTRPDHHGSIQADEITYPTAAVMAGWVAQIFQVWAKDSRSARRQEALDILCGWAMHLAAQDPAVPHHALGKLLDGHAAFEGDIDEHWNRLRGDAALMLTEAAKIDFFPSAMTVRGLAESLATESRASTAQLSLYRYFLPGSWGKLVAACVRRALRASVRLACLLREICSH